MIEKKYDPNAAKKLKISLSSLPALQKEAKELRIILKGLPKSSYKEKIYKQYHKIMCTIASLGEKLPPQI